MKKNIVFIHLLNDYSGSPRVLQSVINASIRNNDEVRIITSGGSGFLSDINGASYSFIKYVFSTYKMLALVRYIIWQIQVFFQVLFLPVKYKVIYINTMHPFGAALAGLIRRNEIIYHIHETSIKPALLKKWLRFVINYSADEIIFVSNYLKESENFPGKNTHVLYNALSSDFQNRTINNVPRSSFTVLMLCSLKKYKGVDEFLNFANRLPEIEFILVLNTTKIEIQKYYSDKVIPQNLTIQSSVKNVHPFYEKADLVMNLSHRDQWIETFGMTVAEAFSYGIPVIVPEVGGIAELVQDNVNGYRLNHDRSDEILFAIRTLSDNDDTYIRMKMNAYESSKRFNVDEFSDVYILLYIRDSLIGNAFLLKII